LILPEGQEQEWSAFGDALRSRRSLVYDYLDNWPGADEFRPSDIHDALFSYIKQRGKALRPLLVLLSCGAVGGDEAQALPAAAAVEVFHTWTLVHDDIIDRDETRRGSPTVHARFAAHARDDHGLGPEEAAHYGNALAILAGDLQQSWCYALLGDLVERGVAAKLVIELIRRMSTSLTPHLMEGELLDVQFSLMTPDTLDEERVLDMLGKKTGALLEYAAWCGATIGLAGRPDPDDMASRLGRFAYLCGIAFQLHDDLLGLTADEMLLGKPVGSDIREGKRTLLVYKALSLADERQRSHILRTLGNPRASSDDILEVITIFETTGTVEQVNTLANSLISQAMGFLAPLAENQYKRLLTMWATFLLARQH
ncbi:MAG: polyprenyl synthetase family protein, partial [Chloroflexota bacterium]|nr:polyprenyl synthetase family protein [Chloroflexota bacterium]